MIGQYLPQTNKSATVPKTFQISELRPYLVPEKFCKIFQIPHHIESLDVCIEY